MGVLHWDTPESVRLYENGVSKGVFYPYNASNTDHPYQGGVEWNGLTSVNESPEGAEIITLYADDIEYLHIMSPEKFGLSIECYDYPEEFNPCIGRIPAKYNTASAGQTPVYVNIPGMYVTSQNHAPFGFSYVTKVGSEANNDLGYKIHLVYGCKAQPTDETRETINDSPNAETKSYECVTTPVDFSTAFGQNFKPTAHVILDSRSLNVASSTPNKTKLQLLEEKLYGTANTQPELPTPADLYTLVG